MKTIWKFPFSFPNAEITLPEDAKIVYVNSQGENRVVCWAEVDPEAPMVTRQFTVVGTGHDVPEGAEYIGSVQDNPYMWHLYERIDNS